MAEMVKAGPRLKFGQSWTRASLVAQVAKNPPANAGDAGDLGLIPGSGRSPGRRNGNPLQYFCLGIPWTEEPGRLESMVSQSRTQPSMHAQSRGLGLEHQSLNL